MPGPRPARSDLRGPLAFLAGGVVGAGIFAVGHWASAPPTGEDLTGYARVRDLVEREFVQDRTREDLLGAALEGLTAELDPYSRFYRGEDLRRVERTTAGTYLGLGLILARPLEDGLVRFPLDGSPARAAGLVPGDRIVAMDGDLLSELPPGAFEQRLGALTDTPVAFLVDGTDGARRTVEVTPAEVLDPSVRHETLLEDGIGYLAITSFTRRTLDEFDAAVQRLDAAGMGSLVVDLRGNPGGVLRAALAVANRFVGEGDLLVTRTREGATPTPALPEEAVLAGLPLVLLVDGDSASASEVLAGALQDHRAAVLVGDATYGKGTVQTLVHTAYPEGIAKITTAFYSTPAGRSIDRHYREDGGAALAPDVQVSLDDEQRMDVRHFLAGHSPPADLADAVAAQRVAAGLPASTRPGTDPQLAAALGLLQPEAGR